MSCLCGKSTVEPTSQVPVSLLMQERAQLYEQSSRLGLQIAQLERSNQLLLDCRPPDLKRVTELKEEREALSKRFYPLMEQIQVRAAFTYPLLGALPEQPSVAYTLFGVRMAGPLLILTLKEPVKAGRGFLYVTPPGPDGVCEGRLWLEPGETEKSVFQIHIEDDMVNLARLLQKPTVLSVEPYLPFTFNVPV